MALLPGGRAEQYSYKARAEASAADDASADEQELRPVVLMD
jgi:hypothetical protein